LAALLLASSLISILLLDSKLTIEELPAEVRTSIDQQAPGASIEKIRWEHPGDSPRYIIEYSLHGVQWHIELAEDGTVLLRERR